MKNHLLAILFALSMAISTNLMADLKVYKQVKILTLNTATASPMCQKYFSDNFLRLMFQYTDSALQRNGFVKATLTYPGAPGLAPIISMLNQLGDSDRLAFSKYYNSPGHVFTVKKHKVYISGVYVNFCSKHSAQAGVKFNFQKRGAIYTCLFTTETWNYCR